MNALHLSLGYFEPSSGVLKKIIAQKESLKRNGFKKVFLGMFDENWVLYIDDNRIHENQRISNFKGRRNFFDSIRSFIFENDINFVYFRFNAVSEPSIIRFFYQLKKKGIVSVMEIPTYPYEGELQKNRFYYLDKYTRNILAQQFKRIVTFSDDKRIFGQPTINISNGIDFNSLPLHNPQHTKHFNLLGVANYRYWHGFDRILYGLKKYKEEENKPMCRFHIVSGKDNEDIDALKQLVKKLGIEDNVIFHGEVSGRELDALFNISQLAIGSLGRHRNNITHLKTLKNVEYAVRGIPFVYSEINSDFETMPYVIKVSQDDTPIDIASLIESTQAIHMSPEKIRQTASMLSWDEQMKKVICECYGKITDIFNK